MRKKEKRYVIDQHSVLPDLLLEKKLYVNKKTKELHQLDSYDMAFQEFMSTADYKVIEDLEEIPNSKAAKILFKAKPTKRL